MTAKILGLLTVGLLAGSTAAHAALLQVDFTVSENWFDDAVDNSFEYWTPFSMPPSPTLTGTMVVDNSLTGASALVDFSLTTGTKTWTKSLLVDEGYSYFHFDVSGNLSQFSLPNFRDETGKMDIYSNNTFGVEEFQTGEFNACNDCVAFTQQRVPDDPYTDPESELRKFFESKSYSGTLPFGTLKIWSGSEYVALSSAEGQALFEHTKDTEVLVHGWNGIGGHNTPLEEKWIADKGNSNNFTMDLLENKNKDTNILAYDWTEAANSRDGAIKNMVMAELGLSIDDYRLLKNDSDCVIDAIACAFILRDRPDLAEMREEFRQSFSTWDSRIDDKWVPNEQIDRQGKALAVQLAGLLSLPDSGSVSLFGHSLGAGVATVAAEELIDRGVSENVARLTLFDAPVDINAILVGGVVNIDDNLSRIRDKSPNVAIDNYYSVAGGALGGFGKAYPDAANIGTVRYEHTPIVAELYPETIRYNESPSNYPYSSDRPEGIGYDDLSGDLVRLRTGTDCTLRLFSPFDGLDNCRTNGFRNVEGGAREEFRTILDFDTYLSIENAMVEINPETRLPTLITGSPVFAFTDDIFVTDDLVGITIDFEWLTRFNEDDFRIWVNDTLVYTLDGLLARDGLLTTGLIDLSRWRNEAMRFSLGVISEFSDSTLAVRDIRFTRDLSEVEYSTVPTPPTVLMVLTGIALLGAVRHQPRRNP